MIPTTRVLSFRPIGGQITGDPAQGIPSEASPDMSNFQVCRGVLKKRPGYAKYGGTQPGSYINGVFSARETGGNRHLFAVTKTDVYRYNTGTTNWDVMTGGPLTGVDGELFSFEVSQNKLVFSQGVDAVQSLLLTGTVYAALNANCPPAKYMVQWNQRLYIAFTVEGGQSKPFRVRWSVAQDDTDWVGVGSGFTDLSDESYFIHNISKWMDTLSVYGDRNITLALKTGNAANPASFQLTVKNVGLLSDFTLIPYNTLHFFVGSDNLYVFDGARINPIFSENRDLLFNILTSTSIGGFFSALNYDCQEYVAFMAVSGITTNNSAWVYNWIRNVQYRWDFVNAIFTYSTLHYLDDSVEIIELVGTIATQGWVIGSSQLTASFPVIILGGKDGKVYQFGPQYLDDNGTAINCRWTSRDFTAGDIDPSLASYMVCLRSVGFTYQDPGTPFTLQFSYSTDRGSTWSSQYPITVGGGNANNLSDAMSTVQVTGKRVRFKIENNTTNELPQIVAFYPELELVKQRIA